MKSLTFNDYIIPTHGHYIYEKSFYSTSVAKENKNATFILNTFYTNTFFLRLYKY